MCGKNKREQRTIKKKEKRKNGYKKVIHIIINTVDNFIKYSEDKSDKLNTNVFSFYYTNCDNRHPPSLVITSEGARRSVVISRKERGFRAQRLLFSSRLRPLRVRILRIA